MTKNDYMSLLTSQAETPAHLYAAFSGQVCGIVLGKEPNDDKVAELNVLIEALEEVENILLAQG